VHGGGNITEQRTGQRPGPLDKEKPHDEYGTAKFQGMEGLPCSPTVPDTTTSRQVSVGYACRPNAGAQRPLWASIQRGAAGDLAGDAQPVTLQSVPAQDTYRTLLTWCRVPACVAVMPNHSELPIFR
jgi:hypothetical protein